MLSLELARVKLERGKDGKKYYSSKCKEGYTAQLVELVKVNLAQD